MDILNDGLEKFRLNNTQNLSIYTDVPEKCKKLPCYVGIDEAGRGPVLGPMVYGIFCAVIDQEKYDTSIKQGISVESIETDPPTALSNIKGLTDSKQVTAKAREEILTELVDKDTYCFGLKFISPTQISGSCFRRTKVNLNTVSHDAAIELLKGMIDRGIVIKKVYLDTVGPKDGYQAKLEKVFSDISIKVDTKADAKYKPVSAASICAKVARDHALKNWTFTPGTEVVVNPNGWGSGYPADPVTKKFLRENVDPVFGFPNLVRNSWSTAKSILKSEAIKIECDAYEEISPSELPAFASKSRSKAIVRQVHTKDSTTADKFIGKAARVRPPVFMSLRRLKSVKRL